MRKLVQVLKMLVVAPLIVIGFLCLEMAAVIASREIDYEIPRAKPDKREAN